MKRFLYGFSLLFLIPSTALAEPIEGVFNTTDVDERSLQGQVNSVFQLNDVQSTDWAFGALQNLVERYGCIAGYPDSTYRGNRAISRYEFAVAINSCLNQINELMDVNSSNFVTQEDLIVLEKLQTDFATELAALRGRVDSLEARTITLETQQFSPTTKLNAQIITAISDSFGNRVGGNDDESNAYFADRGRLNLESSFTGKDLLRVRLEFGNFINSDGSSKIGAATGTGMTRLNFDTNSDNNISVPHVRYYFPVNNSLSMVVGFTGIGYTDITTTVTPPTIADDGNGVPSLYGSYNPLFRRGGGGVAANWQLSKNLMLTVGYLAENPGSPTPKNGIFNGGYNALTQLVYAGQQGAIGVAYSHGYSPGGTVNLTGGTGSKLAISPFGDTIATANNIISTQGYYRFSDNFQIHGWVGYIWANAENSGFSDISNRQGETDSLFVNSGDKAKAWYGALGVSFPDVGGEGNLPGILFGIPPHIVSSDVREDQENAYHLEAFYRWRVNDQISVTPGFWVIFNPENDSRNDTQYVGVLRTTFDF